MAIFSLVAVVTGLIAVFRDASLFATGKSRPAHVSWELFALSSAVACVGLAWVIISNGIEKPNTTILRLGLAQLLFSVAAILIYATRWRPMIEGLGAIALGIVSFLTGFSIGFFVAPFAAVLGVGALKHTRGIEIKD